MLTIDESAIVDPENVGNSGTAYKYQWLISDDGANWNPVSEFSPYQHSYQLTELDVNKYFKSIVKYTDGQGFDETKEGDSFQFTEYDYSDTPARIESFESSAEGWTYANATVSDPVKDGGGTIGSYLGHLDTHRTEVKKSYSLTNFAHKISLDFLKFNSWDVAGHHGRADGDTFSIQVNDQVLFTYRPNTSSGDPYIHEDGLAAGYDWELKPTPLGSSGNVKYEIDITLPYPVKNLLCRLMDMIRLIQTSGAVLTM